MAAYSIPALPLNLCYRATESTLAPTGNYYYFIFVTAVNKPMGVTASGRREIFKQCFTGKADTVSTASGSLLQPDI